MQFDDPLLDLKAQAEAMVLCANDIDGLLTCAIRPCNVFGPGDAVFLPILVNYAKSGFAKVSNHLCSKFSSSFFLFKLRNYSMGLASVQCIGY